MPRKQLILSRELPYHCVNRVQNKQFYPKKYFEKIWLIYQTALSSVSSRHEVKVHLFLLMRNHYHLLMTTPMGNLAEIMREFQSEVSLKVRTLTGREEYKFSSRYKWSLINEPRFFAQTYKYIVQNPVEAKICQQVEQYKYSSFSFQLGHSSSTFSTPIFERQNEAIWELLSDDLIERKAWANSV